MPGKYIFVRTREINKTHHFLLNISSFILHSQKPMGSFKAMIHLAGEEINGQKGKLICPVSHGLLVPRQQLKSNPLEFLVSALVSFTKMDIIVLIEWTVFLFSQPHLPQGYMLKCL